MATIRPPSSTRWVVSSSRWRPPSGRGIGGKTLHEWPGAPSVMVLSGSYPRLRCHLCPVRSHILYMLAFTLNSGDASRLL